MKIETLDKYIKVISEEGHYLTSYKDGEDILLFTSFKVMCAPKGTDLNNLREIEEVDNTYYNELQMQRLKEIENGN